MEGNINRNATKMVDISKLATEALRPAATDEIFVQYRGLFTELCARWVQSGEETNNKVAAFGRILPLAPHLAEHVEHFFRDVSDSSLVGARSSASPAHALVLSQESQLIETLLGIFRLASYDCRSIARYIRPLSLQSFFRHTSRTVRYVAIRTFCLYIHAADHATQKMLTRFVGEGEVEGLWEGQNIDYRFLSLWEEKRWRLLHLKLHEARSTGNMIDALSRQLSPYTVNMNGVLLPRLDGMPSKEKPFELIPTATTASNVNRIAQGLLGSSPLLLTGLAGSGKTLLVRHFAWQLNKLDKMVTLHLNEQSDAKLLIGMYATGAKPGSFSWRPGVLTTAVREGRWIFIEDLDRAPNEVISTLLPLIERGELLIPSRGQTVRAARGFRIIATMRSSLNPRGQQIVPRQGMIGYRFWKSITVEMPQLSEFEHIVRVKYPALEKHIAGIMRVYERLLELYSDPRFSSENGTSIRAMTPRDLMKWCDRIAALLAQSSTFTTARTDDIFLEAFDCFAGSLRSEGARFKVMACVAEELHVDTQRRDHLLRDRDVKLQVPSKNAASGHIQIGRTRLSRYRVSKRTVSTRPFSTNNHTLRLLEKVAIAVDRQEPLLLVGETGTGKTTCIQYLAEQLGRKLVAFNLSQQSESGDLLGGYKPVNIRSLVIPLKDEFEALFDATFSRKKNLTFLEMLGKAVAKSKWRRVCMLWAEALKKVDAARKPHESQTSSPDPEGGQPKKKRKTDSLPDGFPKARWEKFETDLHNFEAQLSNGSEAFAFSFLEGNIVKAVRNGDWVLLDEINLASSDTLEALTDLLGAGPDGHPSLLLTETGNVERVVAHPDFRVFAAMNPATDVGKKDLPSGIRSRFTEIYVESPDGDEKSLRHIVEEYLGGDKTDPAIFRVARDVTSLYLEIQQLAKENKLVDGADQKAHFSLRTLTRTLSYARDIAPLCSLRRALYEGFHMSFLTFLGKASEDLVAPLISKHLFPQKSILKAELGKPLQQPSDGHAYVRQGHYWLRQGVQSVEEQPHYIITPFVQRNINNLIRAASTRKYPVLIQGPTSSGKTSMIEYLAKRSGNKFVRINNHEHTDLQEYLGSYISGADGKLSFQEGILVRALREGHWIVLDELNLAPTDVLEALNRLLDDNRELLIPETQEVVRPHDDFMLFATQNPAGLYGGRKVLSRAFRNRFLELHFDDIPVGELTEILHRRTMIPETWCKRIVQVYNELSTLRQENRIFEQKSFATLRDLFRWAQRKADTVHELANNGYMLLAERVRKEEERVAVKKIIETVMSKSGPKVTIDEDVMFNDDNWTSIRRISDDKASASSGVVWTRAMRRLFVLVAHALRNNEPVLLIGETGCGKTTVCQLLADHFQRQLHIVNAHQNTETGDLIGAQRPIRNRAAIEELLREQVLEVFKISQAMDTDFANIELEDLLVMYDRIVKEGQGTVPNDVREAILANRVRAGALFEWADGSLVHAMKHGHYFLLDEISLADDSVLERLNSVLEPSRALLLAEKGPNDSDITAADGFQFLATMNPGGDYGKKELSPALRNRFTEIWVPAMSDLDDILQIVGSKLEPNSMQYAGAIVSFSQWFNDKYNTSVASSVSIRDTLAWVSFINSSAHDDPVFAVVHGAAMVFIDTLGANPAGLLAISSSSVVEERKACLHHLSKLLGQDVASLYYEVIDISSTDHSFQLGSFSVPKFSSAVTETINFALEAPTTRSNAMRVVRALQLSKPILLEGNPGVGKTTLVAALARAVGKPLTRLNLSEQTDLMDLFGSDVPVEGGAAGTFAWRDAPFLKAMKSGDWVLLDEMNLASQSILEGLNAVLDHRGEVYISELDQTFHKHDEFRVFAAQNPHHQGGGRKGLPASFVNRFTVVYADVFRPDDLALICRKVFPTIEEAEVTKLISFVAALDEQVVDRRSFGQSGAPWEFNLRDTLRWLQLLDTEDYSGSARDFLDAVFVQRFRTENDRVRLLRLFESLYGTHEPRMSLFHNVSTNTLQVGLGVLPRDNAITRVDATSTIRVPQLGPMEALMISIKQNWPVIVVGPSGSGKTSMIGQLASFTGADLVTFSVNADVDAMDLVGGYEQIDPTREVHQCLEKLEGLVRRHIASEVQLANAYAQLLEHLHTGAATATEDFISLLESIAPSDAETSALLETLQVSLQSTKQHIDGARFQWVDGILIRALEQGKWLVLDNANLCSSAVLDRLNSLLEPNGYLSINEHSMANGEARIVRPHPQFRIFLTVDPRFGELSRAMRNRAVEICLLTTEVGATECEQSSMQYPLDSSMYRFRQFHRNEGNLDRTLESCFENLSFQDKDLLQSFTRQVSLGLTAIKELAHTNGTTTGGSMQIISATSAPSAPHALDGKFLRFAEFLRNAWIPQAQWLQHDTGSATIAQMEPFYPLGNELVLHRTDTSKSHASWLSSVYEFQLDLHNMKHAMQTLPSVRFERRKEKQKLPAFLHAYYQGLVKVLEGLWAARRNGQQLDLTLMNPLQTLFWSFYALLEGSTFDRATFQTYLKMLSSAVPSGGNLLVQGLGSTLSKQVNVFGSAIQLTTGLAMERLWHAFKPKTSKSMSQLKAVLELESLADRLDAVMWKSYLDINEMTQIRERIASSLNMVRKDEVDAIELIAGLGAAVLELEHSIDDFNTTSTPYFEMEFEALCQFLDVAFDHQPDSVQLYQDPPPIVVATRARSSLLARRPTKLTSVTIGRSDQASDHFAKLFRHLGLTHQLAHPTALQGHFHVSVLARILSADEVQLSQLDRFETELQLLSQHIALDAGRITQDQRDVYQELYQSIYNQLFASHSIEVCESLREGKVAFYNDVPISDLYRVTLQRGFEDCYRSSGSVDATAWIHLGLFGLMLYVPNYPHDPALRPMIERQMFQEKKDSLFQALASLMQFQQDFTGQNTSFRIRQVENRIHQMGDEPPVPAIVRPEVSELDDLQGEFTNLLSVVQPFINGTMSLEEAVRDATLQQNLSRIIQRLVEGYRAYDDITDTVIGFLVCLNVGLVLGRKDEEDNVQSATNKSLANISRNTPFFGRQRSFGSSEIFLQELEGGLSQGQQAIDVRWHALYSMLALKSTDPPSLTTSHAKSFLHDLFTSFYGDWKKKLLQEQENEAKNSSLYTYRGVDDDIDEEDPSLFPDYEAVREEEENVPRPPSVSRDHAIRVANMHAALYIEDTDASNSLKTLLNWSVSELNRVSNGKSHGTKYEHALPTIYLALEKRVNALSTSGIGRTYNFYFDANLPEAKRIITLVHRIQIRYRQIHKVWPEHATLSEVLRTCDETLEFRHVDPVAKFITKAEKLHGYMHEWQKVASKEYSTANLYDDLTKLLVGWRQVELTTWARLFDLEIDKFRDNAKSWFFVAYETIITASESIDDDKSMKVHAKDLLKSMEGFFEATTLGQFEQRIKLLRQLREQAATRAQDFDNFKIVHTALDNFIAYYARLEKPVHEAIANGRQKLEKDINDIIKLASWKDTNIEALKQSAKTSHRKLSRLVRKFRAILNKPVSGITKGGYPEEIHSINDTTMMTVNTTADPSMLENLANSTPAWDERPTRFKNLSVTTTMMRNLSTPSVDSVDGASHINGFVTELTASILELQKATPSTLTEENKEPVQHLKTQKRKLYADTMKELRQMGVNSNLSVDSLVKQDELSTVLSTLPLINGSLERCGRAAEYYLHKALNIMSQVRAVSREHSGDLTPNDVAKSIGYLEGLLFVTIRQRNVLSKAAHSLSSIETPMLLIKDLCGTAHSQISWISSQQVEATQSVQPNLRWLAAMLKTGADVVSAQAKLGKTHDVDGLLRDMRQSQSIFEDLADRFDVLPRLPSNIGSEAHHTLNDTVKAHTDSFHAVFKKWVDDNDMTHTVLRQIEPFLFQYPEVEPVGFSETSRITLEEYSKEIFGALDLILGSMQDVETALKGAPTSTDDASWLVKEEQALSNAINSLHAPQISSAIHTLLSKMQYLYDDANLVGITGFLTYVKPILDQYVASHTYLVNRFDALHASTANLLHRLSKSFIQIGTQGFCQPPEKSAEQQKGQNEKLEEGTGLGEGEGAEDISKDIEDDEDLEDLAQQKGEREGSIEEQDDAVDMGDQEMEGETEEVGEKEDKGDESGEEGDEDAQSEVGSVDDLGPSAVDEKLWDDGGKEDDAKDKEGKEDVGTENKDEQVAAEQKEDQKEKENNENEDDKEKEGDEEDADMDMEGEDQQEDVGVGETEKMDPHAKEEETLDLPEDLDIDGQDDEGKDDDDLGDMDMGDDMPEDDLDEADAGAQADTVDDEIGSEEEGQEEKDTTGHVEDEEQQPQDEEPEGDEPMDDDAVPLPDNTAVDDEPHNAKDTDQTDANAEAGAGAEANEEAHRNKHEQASATAANQDEGQEGEDSEQKQETTAEDGSLGQTTQPDAGGRGEQPEESREKQSFKKLGDVLEKWYNQQKQISEAREKDDTQVQQIDKEIDMADADFEHLQDKETKADTQALGTATEEQAKALDHDMALPMNEDEEKIPARPEDDNVPADAENDVEMADVELEKEETEEEQQQLPNAAEGQPQAFVGEQKPFSRDNDQDMEDATPLDEEVSDTSSVEEVETQLELTHLDPSAISTDTARSLWLAHESATHSLSQQLTEHLRLILAPTLATKLRGDFRTGKRLNLKRIIPYIASGYKRDKIWLRRSQPSKRSYQVMIALDDSKSMAESGASNLALKTLTLVARSLAMLEVGEVSVVGFGDQVNVAHDFDKPFTSEAGVKVFEQFGFNAAKTNVRGLVDKSLELFADARRTGSSSAGEDLWQLMLIVSDGICDSHADIQRLVRKAQEERVMIVFVIIDSSASAPSATPVPAPSEHLAAQPSSSMEAANREKEKTSILDLQSVEITPEGKVVRWKYMERFPFRYYLVVRDVRELPGVLAGALRQWFGEVAGSA
jgi:midasin